MYDMEKESFLNFMFTNYRINQNGLDIKEDEYIKMLQYIKSGNLISKKFTFKKSNIQECCLKYGFFDEVGIALVGQVLQAEEEIKKLNLSIDDILEKCSKIDVEIYPSYSFLVEKFKNDKERLKKIFKFADLNLLYQCAQILVLEEIELEPSKITKITKKELSSIISKDLWEKVDEILIRKNYNEIIDLLYDKESYMNNDEYIFKKNKTTKEFNYEWLETIEQLIKKCSTATKIFSLFFELYVESGCELECFDTTFESIKTYSKSIQTNKHY